MFITYRWNIYAIEELPDYMKICFLGFYNSVNDMAYTTLTDSGFFILPYLQKAVSFIMIIRIKIQFPYATLYFLIGYIAVGRFM